TNTPLTAATEDERLIAKNKWLVCHGESKAHVEAGRVVGLIGDNIKI
ncbi:MAG: DUF4867 family protein, partial [Clostridia bacterium]|nr:DUF4867 family protein [Clostridia bacterium]